MFSKLLVDLTVGNVIALYFFVQFLGFLISLALGVLVATIKMALS